MQEITSEYIGTGHPDKLADIIADAILDSCLAGDPNSRVACEVMLTGNTVILAGEITTGANIDYIQVARRVLQHIGYYKDGIDFVNLIRQQSIDIANKVDSKTDNADDVNAGDQGFVVGYAIAEPNYLPLSYIVARELVVELQYKSEDGTIKGIHNDSKSQVTMLEGTNIVKNIVISVHHDSEKELEELRNEIQANVVDKVVKHFKLDVTKATININNGGAFTIGGFEADTGLTNRKLMCMTYGGGSKHGGGGIQGKDPTKVDRSGALMARYIAKNIVVARLALKCQVTLAYVIGSADPTSIAIDTFNTGSTSDDYLVQLVRDVFDCSVGGIIKTLDLRRPIYTQAAANGNFIENGDFTPWENTDKASELLKKLASAYMGLADKITKKN